MDRIQSNHIFYCFNLIISDVFKFCLTFFICLKENRWLHAIGGQLETIFAEQNYFNKSYQSDIFHCFGCLLTWFYNYFRLFFFN